MSDLPAPRQPSACPPPPGSATDGLRCGLIAVVGRTNAGKSTLINCVLREKVSIVSPIPQTTRNVIRAVYHDPRGQLILVDTPGLHRAKGDLGKLMNRMAKGAIADVDAVMLMLDGARRPRAEDESWMREMLTCPSPCIFVLNKRDRSTFDAAPFHETWRRIQSEKSHDREVAWIELSATNDVDFTALLDRLFEIVPESPELFPDDMITDYPRRLAMADVIREKFHPFLHDELPHDLGVCVTDIEEQPHGWNVAATIYVDRHSQKPIVLGRKGRHLRSVRRQAEPELSEMFDVPIALSLWVKVERHWARNFWLLRQMGHAGR